jgi:hypothetical protein
LHQLLFHAFGRIVNEGVSADVAFGLKLRRGKYPRSNTIARDVMIAALVVLHRRRGHTLPFAQGEAANAFCPDGKGEKAVAVAYKKHRATFETLPDSSLLDLLPKSISDPLSVSRI